ncbi:flagellar biosynthetic protein FliR [Geomonas sp. RF6]|uniref:flagellar biosynthetic protein FliR n=1 Tax=Geomonas sp. RF6 TaxID=2897342 RepID=UPI001E3CD0B5|nr:flagellar biosynthetic protein FliR [Geomonas sp. RF6]UFS72342.1 flagellar biosynthetic protein FliR [Geomonas sp. RF6]
MFGNLPLTSLEALPVFALVLARVAGLFSAIPIFGARIVPARVKAGLVFVLSLLLYPVIHPQIPPDSTDTISLVLLVLGEVLIGLTLGLMSQAIFAAVEFCGQLVGTQMGLSMASLFDPTTQNNVPTMAMFQGALATLLFVSLNAHHIFLRGIVESYQRIPIGGWHMSGGLLQFVIEASTGIFIIAVKLSAPVSVALLATSVVLGIVARAFPQMNVFMVSMPLNIGMGLALLGISLPVFLRVLANSFGAMSGEMTTIFKLLGS